MLEIDKQLSRVKNDLCPIYEFPNISADDDFTSSCGISDVTVKCIGVYRISAIPIKEQGATNENI